MDEFKIKLDKAVKFRVVKIHWAWKKMRPCVDIETQIGTLAPSIERLYETDKINCTVNIRSSGTLEWEDV